MEAYLENAKKLPQFAAGDFVRSESWLASRHKEQLCLNTTEGKIGQSHTGPQRSASSMAAAGCFLNAENAGSAEEKVKSER
jgi:hypothetical protein